MIVGVAVRVIDGGIVVMVIVAVNDEGTGVLVIVSVGVIVLLCVAVTCVPETGVAVTDTLLLTVAPETFTNGAGTPIKLLSRITTLTNGELTST